MVRIAVLADIHYGEQGAISVRRGDFGDILLLRAAHRLNRWLRPDLTVILGDLVDLGGTAVASQYRARLRDVVRRITVAIHASRAPGR